jgi:hypothetical protein
LHEATERGSRFGFGAPWVHRRSAQIWPLNADPFLAGGVLSLANWVNAAPSAFEPNHVFLEPLLEPDRPWTETGYLALAVALVSKDSDARGAALDVLIAGIEDGRAAPAQLADVFVRLMPGGCVKLNRVQQALAEVARVSPLNASSVSQILEAFIIGVPSGLRITAGPCRALGDVRDPANRPSDTLNITVREDDRVAGDSSHKFCHIDLPNRLVKRRPDSEAKREMAEPQGRLTIPFGDCENEFSCLSDAPLGKGSIRSSLRIAFPVIGCTASAPWRDSKSRLSASNRFLIRSRIDSTVISSSPDSAANRARSAAFASGSRKAASHKVVNFRSGCPAAVRSGFIAFVPFSMSQLGRLSGTTGLAAASGNRPVLVRLAIRRPFGQNADGIWNAVSHK